MLRTATYNAIAVPWAALALAPLLVRKGPLHARRVRAIGPPAHPAPAPGSPAPATPPHAAPPAAPGARVAP